MTIKVNLLHREERPKRAGVKGLSLPKLSIRGGLALKGAGALLVLVFLAVAVAAYMARQEKVDHEKAIARLKAQDAVLQRQLTELRVAEAAKKEIQRRLDIIGRVAKSQGLPVAMMNGVLKSVPQGIWLTAFDVKPQEVKVRVDQNRPSISYTSATLAQLQEKQQEVGPASSARGAQAATREVTEIRGYSVVIKGMAFNNFQVAEFMEKLRLSGVFSDVDFTVTQATSVEQVRVTEFEVTANVKL